MTIIILFIAIAICGFFIVAHHSQIDRMDYALESLYQRVAELEGEENDRKA